MCRKLFFLLLLPVVLILPVVLFISYPVACYANSPPPPVISIIVSHAPEGLELSIGSEKARRIDRIFESYFTFYLNFTNIGDTLTVTEGDNNFEVALPKIYQYNSVFRLDLGSRSLTTGISSWRPYEFASMTLVLTLVVEGVIFFMFGYRKRISWIVFLVTNIVTQGLLYVWLNKAYYPLLNSYSFPVYLSLVLGEILVFIVEIIVFLIIIKERPRAVTLSYVVLANLASLFLGGFLINILI